MEPITRLWHRTDEGHHGLLLTRSMRWCVEGRAADRRCSCRGRDHDRRECRA